MPIRRVKGPSPLAGSPRSCLSFWSWPSCFALQESLRADMDLNTISELVRPSARQNLGKWQNGDAWLAGGTWLFSEPQPSLRRLIDLDGFGWTPIEIKGDVLSIAATAKIAEL